MVAKQFPGSVYAPDGSLYITLTDGAGNLATVGGGGGGTPGAPSLSLQYNNAGSFAGMSGTSWDDTNRALTLTGATVTTNKPILDLSQTWNNAATTFTAFKVNVTNSASNLFSTAARFQIGGADLLTIDTNQGVTVIGNLIVQTSALGATPRQVVIAPGAAATVQIGSANAFAWANSTDVLSGSTDLFLLRDASAILAQRNSTTAQTLRVYNTFTDASNYERGVMDWTTTANTLTIGTQAAGTGTLRPLVLAGSAISTTTDVVFASASAGTFQTILSNAAGQSVLSSSGGESVVFGVCASNSIHGLFVTTNNGAATAIGFLSGNYNNPADTMFFHDAAGIFGQRNSTTAQTLRVYNTFTDASNFERAMLDWTTTANVLTIGSQALGTGTLRPVVVAGASVQLPGNTRVTADVGFTSTTVLATVTGLSVSVAAGRTYRFEACLQVTDAAAGGVQAAIAGTATATAIQYTGYTIADNAIKGKTNATALATAVASTVTTETTGILVMIYGTITVNAAGTLLVQAAQNTSNGTATTVKRGSYFNVYDLA